MNKLLNKLLGKITRRKACNQKDNDFARKYGWWLLIGEQKIGELEYVGWDETSQFWYEYKVNLFNKKYESITKNLDHWHNISVQNKNSKYSKIHTDYMPAIRTDEIIAIRGLFEAK